MSYVRIAICIACVVAFSAPAFAVEPTKLNVLFLMADDMRPDLGCYGNTLVKSPNIDALAGAGVRFEHAYCQFPLCNPSRASLLTGRHPINTGVLGNRTWFGAAHPDFVSLPRLFKDNGYASLRSGKIFHGGIDDFDAWSEGGEKRRFEGADWTPPANPNQAAQSDRRVVLEGNGETHEDYKAATRAIDYLNRYKDKPFFIGCGFKKPHSAPSAPQKFYDLYDPQKIPLPPDFEPRPTVPAGFPKASVPARNSDLFVGRDASPEAAREMIQAYWASLSFTDSNVGRVLAELDRLGLRRRTVVVFWGDHGYHLGEKGKWSKHNSLFEVGTRVPLIVSAPDAKGNGQPCARVVETLDLYPTLCDLCGLTPPTGIEGRSLKPLLENPGAAWDRPAYTVSGGPKAGVAVRTERFRYVEYEGGAGGAMLFDHAHDPHEMKNVIDDPQFADARQRLSALAKKHMAGQ